MKCEMTLVAERAIIVETKCASVLTCMAFCLQFCSLMLQTSDASVNMPADHFKVRFLRRIPFLARLSGDSLVWRSP